jgi:hypothetical protein
MILNGEKFSIFLNCIPFMKFIKLLLAQLIALNSFGQDSTKEIRFTQVDWTLNVPFVSQVQCSILKDTIKQISPTYIKERVTIEKDIYNTCSIKVKPATPDSLKKMSDEAAFTLSKKIIALDFTQDESDLKFTDSASSFEIIDNVRFDIFYYKIKPLKQQRIYNVYWFYSKYDGHDINIDISYDDQNLKLGAYILAILRKSKFGKS